MLKLSLISSYIYFAVLTTICFIFSMSIASRIRSLRQSRDLTQQQLGERIGRTQQEIYRWEKGLVRVHGDDIAKMALALDVSVIEFFDELDNAVDTVDWDFQAAIRDMPKKDRQKLIDYLRTAYGKKREATS